MMRNGEQEIAGDIATVKIEKPDRRKSKDKMPSEEQNTDPNEEENHEKQSTENDDGDDPVVHEIPVYLAKSLANQLYLLQVNRCKKRLHTSHSKWHSCTKGTKEYNDLILWLI